MSAKSSDTLYVIDCSRSMGDRLGDTKVPKIELAKAALISVLSYVNYSPKDRVGITGVNTNIFGKPVIREILAPTEILPLIESKTVPIDKVMLLKNDGGTAIAAGIIHALDLLTKTGTLNSLNLVVITDSQSNPDVQPGRIVTAAGNFHVKVHFVVLGNGKTKEKFRLVSDLTGGEVSYVKDQYELERSLLPVRVALQKAAEAETEQSKDNAEQIKEIMPEAESTALVDLRAPKPNKVTPKRKRPETVEDIQSSVRELLSEYSSLEKELRDGKISQSQFAEGYSVIHYELFELRNSIRDVRSKLSREMMEYALISKTSGSNNSAVLREANEHLTQLDKQIASLYETAKVLS